MYMPQAPPPPPPPPPQRPMDQHLPAQFDSMSLDTNMPHLNPSHHLRSPVFEIHHDNRPQGFDSGLPLKVDAKQPVSYEGYVYSKVRAEGPGRTETWARVNKTALASSQKELYTEVKKQKNKQPSYTDMKGFKQQQINHLIEQRTNTDDDTRFEYKVASIKLNPTVNAHRERKTKTMQVILKRQLRPGVAQAATMGFRSHGADEIVDLNRLFDDRSSQNSDPVSGHSFTEHQGLPHKPGQQHFEPHMHGHQHFEPHMHDQQHFEPHMPGGPGAHMPMHPGPHMGFPPQHIQQQTGMQDHEQFMGPHDQHYAFLPEHPDPDPHHDQYQFTPNQHTQPQPGHDHKAEKKDHKHKKDDKKGYKNIDKYCDFPERSCDSSTEAHHNRHKVGKEKKSGKKDYKEKKGKKHGHKNHDKYYEKFSDRSYDSSTEDSDTSYRTPDTVISSNSSRDYSREKKYHSSRKEKAPKSRDYERDYSPRRQIYREHRRKSPTRSPRAERRRYDYEEVDMIPGGLRDRPQPGRRTTDYFQPRPSLDHHRQLSYDDDFHRDLRRSPPLNLRPTSIYTQRRLRDNTLPIDLYHDDHDLERELRREAAAKNEAATARDMLRERDLRALEDIKRERARREDDLFRRDRMARDTFERPVFGGRIGRVAREGDYY